MCGELPDFVLADGHQSFCATEGCPVLTWDGHATADENLAHASRVDLTVGGIVCPRCGLRSFHPRDVAEGYCGNCHDWTGGRNG